jgi:hypothetical protein
MQPVGIVMTNGNVAVNAMQFPCFFFVIEMCLTTLPGEPEGVVVLVTVDAGGLKHMTPGIIDLGFCFPVKACRIFKGIGPYIANPGFGLLQQVAISMGREVTIHAMHMDAPGIVVVGRAFPALGRVRMNMAGIAIFIGGCYYYCLVAQKDKQGSKDHPKQEYPSALFISLSSHNQ